MKTNSNFVNKKHEVVTPIPNGQAMVACPMLVKFDVLVEISYCKNKCQFYDSITTSETGKDDEIVCLFPRKIKIYNVAT
jgi:hypothetical protein